MRPRLSSRLLTLSLGLALAGCSSVAPWERGNLAKPQMSAESRATQQTILDHIYESREAASGKTSAKGGACGCY
jgi:hypothetical protein